MLLTCPTCARSYTVRPADLGENGRLVICPNCQMQWLASGVAPVPPASNDDSVTSAAKGRHVPTPQQLAAGPSLFQRMILRRAPPVVAGIVAVVMLVQAIDHRNAIVRHVPRLASLYAAVGLGVNVRGLTFGAIAPLRLASSDVTISGLIHNIAGHRVAVPRVAFEVRDPRGTPLLTWSEKIPADTLGAGTTLPFTSSPHHMPTDSASVSIRFAADEAEPVRRVVASRAVN